MPWWTNECQNAIRNRNKAFKIFNRNINDENYIEFKRTRALARKIIKNAKKNAWKEFISKINKDTSVKEIFQYIKRIKGKNSARPICLLINGNIIDDPKEIADNIAEHFSNVSDDQNYTPAYRVNKIQNEHPINFDSNTQFEYNEPFTMAELKYVLGSVKGTSAGPDGIRYEMIKNIRNIELSKILQFYNDIWETQTFPKHWSEAITIPILKTGKDPKDPSSYRPIALTNVLCKLMERLVNNRLKNQLEKQNLLNNSQSGFRRNRSTFDNLIKLENDIQISKTHNEYTMALFLDIEKAFDMCSRWGILKKMHNMGLRGKLPIFVENFMKNRSFRVKVNNSFSNIKVQKNGVPQGSVLSPTLFIIMINDILDNPPEGIKLSLYADDVAIWISSSSLQYCKNQIQKALNILQTWSNKWGLKFSAQKTKAMVFTIKRNILVKHKNLLKLKIDNNEIEFVNNFKFLGLHFDSKLKWNIHIKNLQNSLISSINLLKIIRGNNWGADRHSLRMIYKTMIRAKLDYACFIYSTASKLLLQKLNVLQNKCLRLISGALRCSRIERLEVESAIEPLTLRREQLTVNQALNILTNENHTCKDLFRTAEIYNLSIYQPFATRAMILQKELKIPFDKINPSKSIDIQKWEKYQKYIHQNQHMNKNLPKELLYQESLKIINRYKNINHIYTDGSVIKNKSGAGIYSHNYTTSIRISDDTNIFDTEAFAILKAIENATNKKLNSIIFTDSKSCTQAIYTGKTKNPIILQIIDKIIKSKQRLYISWIPAHIGICGNEAADKYAKQAILLNEKTDVPISPKRFKKITKNKVLIKWQTNWTNLNIRNKYKPLVKDYRTSYRENRLEEKILSRLRCGATFLTHMKAYMEKNFPPPCINCNNTMTISHLLLHCNKYNNERTEIINHFQNLINIPLNVKNLLADNEEIIDLLFEFINNTDLKSKL